MKKRILNLLNKIYIHNNKKELLKKIEKYGKCIVYDDEIICEVDEKKLKKNALISNESEYTLIFTSFLDKEIVKLCGLDKPITYIFDRINFDKDINIYAFDNTTIWFLCSKFNKNISIKMADKVKFCCNYYNKKSDFKISIQDANTIQFIDETNFSTQENNNTSFHFNAKEVEFYRGKIEATQSLFVEAKKFLTKESVINANELCIKANNIIGLKSKTIANDKIIIKSDTCDKSFIDNIVSPNKYFNGVEFTTTEDLNKQRLLLLETLRKIRDNCNEYISEKATKISNDMKNKKVKKYVMQK